MLLGSAALLSPTATASSSTSSSFRSLPPPVTVVFASSAHQLTFSVRFFFSRLASSILVDVKQFSVNSELING